MKLDLEHGVDHRGAGRRIGPFKAVITRGAGDKSRTYRNASYFGCKLDGGHYLREGNQYVVIPVIYQWGCQPGFNEGEHCVFEAETSAKQDRHIPDIDG